MKIDAIYRKPTGFSDIRYYEYNCTILDFVVINSKPQAIIRFNNKYSEYDTLSAVDLNELYIKKGE